MRSVIAIAAGYLIFALSAVALFQLTGQRPHEVADPTFILTSVLYGFVFALIGGYVAARLAPRHPRRHAAGVGCYFFLGAGRRGGGRAGPGEIASAFFILLQGTFTTP